MSKCHYCVCRFGDHTASHSDQRCRNLHSGSDEAIMTSAFFSMTRVGYWLGSALLLAGCSKIEPEAR